MTPPPFDEVAIDNVSGSVGVDGTGIIRVVATGRSPFGTQRIERYLAVDASGGAWRVSGWTVAPGFAAGDPTLHSDLETGAN